MTDQAETFDGVRIRAPQIGITEGKNIQQPDGTSSTPPRDRLMYAPRPIFRRRTCSSRLTVDPDTASGLPVFRFSDPAALASIDFRIALTRTPQGYVPKRPGADGILRIVPDRPADVDHAALDAFRDALEDAAARRHARRLAANAEIMPDLSGDWGPFRVRNVESCGMYEIDAPDPADQVMRILGAYHLSSGTARVDALFVRSLRAVLENAHANPSGWSTAEPPRTAAHCDGSVSDRGGGWAVASDARLGSGPKIVSAGRLPHLRRDPWRAEIASAAAAIANMSGGDPIEIVTDDQSLLRVHAGIPAPFMLAGPERRSLIDALAENPRRVFVTWRKGKSTAPLQAAHAAARAMALAEF